MMTMQAQACKRESAQKNGKLKYWKGLRQVKTIHGREDVTERAFPTDVIFKKVNVQRQPFNDQASSGRILSTSSAIAIVGKRVKW